MKSLEPQQTTTLSSQLVLALDLEGTLISTAVSQFPRPGLFEFLERCHEMFSRVVVFTAVNEPTFRKIAQRLATEGTVPSWFPELSYVRWNGDTKDLTLIPGAHIDNVFLVDDLSAYVHPGQQANWIEIAPFVPPYDDSDVELAKVLAELEKRIGGPRS
ncbi:HAD family hydrolase [Variovorax sp. Sphag1AA]|uniref:HAD family hydrolase n=1 Tax=Variovorax sp. Sphag1AA TaxID=2587027 RepID=UPI0016113A60|nr:HAD family hydrolase [Variovorax sp. Sphag1AA]MBB3182277.1 hypothetical protein [Variovorax sp. Sphag1AA]